MRVPWSDYPHLFWTMSTPKKFWSVFKFLWICINMQKLSLFHLFILQLQSILESSQQTGQTHLSLPTPEIINHHITCMNLFQSAKNKLISSVHSWDTLSFRAERPDWPNSFLAMYNQKRFPSTFIVCGFLSSCKKWGCFINLFWKKFGSKIPAIWLAERTFAYISDARFFPISDLCGNTKNNINFQ